MTGVMVANVFAWAGALGSCCWIWLLIQTLARYGSVVRIVDQPADPAPEGPGWPTLAAVFAARNEEPSVERAVRSLLGQDYPGLAVIAVDDRSTDRTGAILDAVARDDPRLRVIHVQELLPGWLGKTHALQVAAAVTTAEWLLFTDADVVFAEGALRRAVGLAVRGRFDHVAAVPDIITETIGERVFLAMFILLFALVAPPWRVADRRRKAALGLGAFNLVRGSAFRAMGGFERVSLSVDDDLRLGQALKFAGYRGSVVLGQDALSVRWQVGLGGMIRGLEKNFFGGLDYRPELVPVVLVGLVIVGVLPFAGLFHGLWWTRAVCAAGVGAIAGFFLASRRMSGVAWYHGLLLPVGAAALATALLRSVWLTYRRGGVRWRDHHYPLVALRDHVRRRNAWLREVWLSTR
jgi:Glycosyl transferase family 2